MSHKFNKYGVGAAVLALAIAGGYVARAETNAKAGQAVNTPAAPATAPIGAAPASFADIIQRVAPAVVSIEVEGKVQHAAYTRGGDDDDEGGSQQFFFNGQPGNLDQLPPELRQFFGQQFGQGQGQGQGQRGQRNRRGGDDGEDTPTMHGAGSGFFISADGYIATNNHVIDHADKITVTTNDGRKLTAHVVGHDPGTDLAVIKVDGKNLPFVSFEDRAKPRVGDWVVAVGNPFELGGTATAGIVSAFNRKSDTNYVDYMQIDAPINPGNSGGPTFDLYGRVVGINSAIYSQSGGSIGIGFDIPADVAAKVTKQLISTGKISRGYIGATVQDLTPEIADGMGIKADKGALVADITRGGPAADAGLKSGDVVLKIDGHDLKGATDLTRAVAEVHAGDAIHLDVLRAGKPMSVTIHAGDRPDEDKLAQNDEPREQRFGFGGQ